MNKVLAGGAEQMSTNMNSVAAAVDETSTNVAVIAASVKDQR